MEIKGKRAYGLVFQEVTRNENIRPAAKGLYAYLSSFCGEKDECYPSAKLIAKEMGMGKTAFYNAMNELIAAGVVVKCQLKGESGKFGRNTYKLTHNVYFTEKPCTDNRYTVLRSPDIGTTNNNSINNNNINSNSKSIFDSRKENAMHPPYQQIIDMYNSICTSLPRITTLSEACKKEIYARCRQYSMGDFKKLFEMAEGSSFLKGGNGRNWSASFDWLMTEENMAKVLNGNYTNKQPMQGQPKKPYGQFSQRECLNPDAFPFTLIHSISLPFVPQI